MVVLKCHLVIQKTWSTKKLSQYKPCTWKTVAPAPSPRKKTTPQNATLGIPVDFLPPSVRDRCGSARDVPWCLRVPVANAPVASNDRPTRWTHGWWHHASVGGETFYPGRVGAPTCVKGCVFVCVFLHGTGFVWSFFWFLKLLLKTQDLQKVPHISFEKITRKRHLHGSWLVQDDHALHVAIPHIAQDLRPMSCRDLQRISVSWPIWLHPKQVCVDLYMDSKNRGTQKWMVI